VTFFLSVVVCNELHQGEGNCCLQFRTDVECHRTEITITFHIAAAHGLLVFYQKYLIHVLTFVLCSVFGFELLYSGREHYRNVGKMKCTLCAVNFTVRGKPLFCETIHESPQVMNELHFKGSFVTILSELWTHFSIDTMFNLWLVSQASIQLPV
jgi:hypothetical protein